MFKNESEINFITNESELELLIDKSITNEVREDHDNQVHALTFD